MANDDCHPRFIACMLRLGDLLDIDDNRFCPVMQGIAGESRPALSKAHEDKHASIRHFRLDPERIEVTAVCDSVDGYVEQWRWLDGLRMEIQRQMSHWQDIAPQRSLGLLPTIGEINVGIAGRKLITKPGARTEFQLNADRALKLLQGENLYKRTDTIRELLQNAVDATLLRLWQTEKSKFTNGDIQPGDFSNPSFSRYPIHVLLQRSTKPASTADKINWTLSITDQGAGMSSEDLSFLMNVAGSGNNTKRQEIIQSMPVWLRPSGNFDIGFQSVFMWTEKARLLTKSLQTNEVLNVTLHSPNGPQRGLVEVERADGNPIDYKAGTQLTFELETATIHRKPFEVGNDSPFQVVLDQYDPLFDNEPPLEAMELINAARVSSLHSPIRIQWKYHNSDFVFSSNANSNQEANEEEETEEEEPWDFIPETNSLFQASLASTSESYFPKCRVFYRGQPVEKFTPIPHCFFNYQIDIYADTASDWLTFDRNNLSSKGMSEIGNIVNQNIKIWVERNKTQLLNEQKAELSALAKHQSNIEDSKYHQFWLSLQNELPTDWKKLTCPTKKNAGRTSMEPYENILQTGCTLTWASHTGVNLDFNFNNKKLAFVNPIEMHFCLNTWLNSPDHGIRYSIEKRASFSILPPKRIYTELITINHNEHPLQIDPQSNLLEFIENTLANLEGISQRLMLPMMMLSGAPEIHKLKLINDVKVAGGRFVFPHTPTSTCHVVLPYEITAKSPFTLSISLNRLDDFLEFIWKNLANPISFDEVKNIYRNLMNFIDNELMKNSEIWNKHRSEGRLSHAR